MRLRKRQRLSIWRVDALAEKSVAAEHRFWIADRGDDARRRHYYPAAVLSLDLFDRTEAGQRRAGNYPIDVAVALYIDMSIA